MSVIELEEEATEYTWSEWQTVSYHLTYNLFPPVVDGEEFALAVIEAIREDAHDRIIEVGYRRWRAGDVYVEWHLARLGGDESEHA